MCPRPKGYLKANDFYLPPSLPFSHSDPHPLSESAMWRGISFRHSLLLLLQLCKFSDSGTRGRWYGRRGKWETTEKGGTRRETAVNLKHDFLFSAAQLLAVIQGKTVVLGKEGETAELPCEGSSKKNAVFNWKLPDQRKILGRQNNILVKGKFPCPLPPTQEGKQ